MFSQKRRRDPNSFRHNTVYRCPRQTANVPSDKDKKDKRQSGQNIPARRGGAPLVVSYSVAPLKYHRKHCRPCRTFPLHRHRPRNHPSARSAFQWETCCTSPTTPATRVLRSHEVNCCNNLPRKVKMVAVRAAGIVVRLPLYMIVGIHAAKPLAKLALPSARYAVCGASCNPQTGWFNLDCF